MNNKLKEFQNAESSIEKQKPRVEGMVANYSKVHRGMDSRKYGISPLQ
jgi:hypothetical protein